MEWYLFSLSTTVALELLCGILLGYRSKKEIVAIIGVNLITHPLLHYYSPSGMTDYIAAEVLVACVEYVLLCYTWKRSFWSADIFFLALSMNMASFLAGEMLLK